jgi:hypothetical protein
MTRWTGKPTYVIGHELIAGIRLPPGSPKLYISCRCCGTAVADDADAPPPGADAGGSEAAHLGGYVALIQLKRSRPQPWSPQCPHLEPQHRGHSETHRAFTPASSGAGAVQPAEVPTIDDPTSRTLIGGFRERRSRSAAQWRGLPTRAQRLELAYDETDGSPTAACATSSHTASDPILETMVHK